MPYKHYKDTVSWLASVLSKDVTFDELMTMTIVSVIADAFEISLETVVADVTYALQGM